MLPGSDHIHQAVQLLVGRNIQLNERFLDAAAEFVAALHHAEQWPDDLRQRARGIAATLTADGDMEETIRAMDASTVEAIADDMLDFAEALATAQVRASEPDHRREDALNLAVAHCHFRPAGKAKGRRRQRKATSSSPVSL
ncbi:MAG: hypothetical protein JXB62_12355 [Pirellulales bacterium]|nr:hypothetical protein [Pirellulales bacterium]